MIIWKRIKGIFNKREATPSGQPVLVRAPRRSTSPPARSSFAEQRAARRFNVPSRGTLHFVNGGLTSDCKVLDAGRNGVRVVVPDEFAHERIHGFSIFFNGHILSTKVRIAWAASTANGCELGLVFQTRSSEASVLDLFESYFCWREARAA
jgi:hypothetical protein